MLTKQQIDAFERDGYLVVSGLFPAQEIESYADHFMRLRAAGNYQYDLVADVSKPNDPLEKFPRMIHMHRWDDLSRQWVIDSRINACLTALLGAEPYAVQTMLYFKPPGARGQALHQDNMYLQAHPGTCMAAWLALDDCDEQNGCMQIIPGSHKWPILCPTTADMENSFSNIAAPLPSDAKSVPVIMKAGDILFFGGSLVHGSYPNTTSDRFRRTLIGHYVEGKARQLTTFDQPMLTMDGREVNIDPSPGGAPCGVWSENGTVEMSGILGGASGGA